MEKCKNCKYWEKYIGEYTYNENFGYCNCRKMVYREELGYDVDKKNMITIM